MALHGKVSTYKLCKGEADGLVGALLVLLNVEHVVTLPGVPESSLPSWLKTGHELPPSYDNDLLDHLTIFSGQDKIIRAVFLCALSSSSAFTKKPGIPLHRGLSPTTHMTGDLLVALLMKQMA